MAKFRAKSGYGIRGLIGIKTDAELLELYLPNGMREVLRDLIPTKTLTHYARVVLWYSVHHVSEEEFADMEREYFLSKFYIREDLKLKIYNALRRSRRPEDVYDLAKRLVKQNPNYRPIDFLRVMASMAEEGNLVASQGYVQRPEYEELFFEKLPTHYRVNNQRRFYKRRHTELDVLWSDERDNRLKETNGGAGVTTRTKART